MKILYVAKHDSGDNDPEGAIAHVLTEMGHEVVAVYEDRAGLDPRLEHRGHDLCLFHKWPDFSLVQRVRCPKVAWYFDMVGDDGGDPPLVQRSRQRRAWLTAAREACDLVFMTDGDAVAEDHSGKLVWLMQGVDARYAGFGTAAPWLPQIPILFTGGANTKRPYEHGTRRMGWVKLMKAWFGSKFVVVGDSIDTRKVKRELADLIARADVVVAPDSPCGPYYWSNRVYLTLGMGGFLLHPHCVGMDHQYVPHEEYIPYRDRDDLVERVRSALEDEDYRNRIARAGYMRTITEHTYHHRVRDLLRTVKERLDVG